MTGKLRKFRLNKLLKNGQSGTFFFRINRDENELGSITSHCAKLGTPRGISIHWEINSRITQEKAEIAKSRNCNL